MENEYLQSHLALEIAFRTMKERCQLLEARLFAVEEDNSYLRQCNEKCDPVSVTKLKKGGVENVDQSPKNIDELNQKSQLIHHFYMVSSENRLLWKRLCKFLYPCKSLSNQLTNISESQKQHSSSKMLNLTYSYREISELIRCNINDKRSTLNEEENENGLENASLQVINNSAIKQSELEQQQNEIGKLQFDTKMSLNNIGFTYPEDISEDSLEYFECHDMNLIKINDALLSQQDKLKNTLKNLKKIRNYKICNRCKSYTKQLRVQAGTQFDFDNSFKKNEATQTSLSTLNIVPDKKILIFEDNENICPLCGMIYEKSLDLFHEHVVGHFTEEI